MIDSAESPGGETAIAARRRRDIAMAARAELMEKGVEGLRMRAVAARAGINIATLDYHCGGKDGLIALVAESLVGDFRAQKARHPDREAWPALERLAQELRDFRALRQEKPEVHHIMASLSRRAAGDPGIARHIVPMKAHWHGRIAAIMADGRRDGSLRATLDVEAAARLFIWSILALASPDHAEFDFPQHAAEIMRGYAADPAQDFTGWFT